MADGRRVADLLADRPDLQSSLAAILDVDIPGTSFTYDRQAATNATGAYAVRVAQPGTYDVPKGLSPHQPSAPPDQCGRGDTRQSATSSMRATVVSVARLQTTGRPSQE